MSLIHAFRRRWIPAIAVAIPAALLAAVVLWELVPAPYESYSVVKIAQYKPVLYEDTRHGESDFLNFRDSQMAYIRSRVVLQAAVSRPEVAQTETIRQLKYPVDFLAESLLVETVDSEEFIRIALRGDRPRELALIVNAIKDAYMNEVVYAERNKTIAKLEKLEKLLAEKRQQLKVQHERVDELAGALGTVDSRIANLNITMAQQNLAALNADRRKIQSDLLDEEARRNARIQAGLPPDAPASPVTGQPGLAAGAAGTEAYRASRIAFLRQLIDRYESSVAADHSSSTLDKYRKELTELESEGGETVPGVRFSRYEYLKSELTRLDGEVAASKDLIETNGRKAIELERENRAIKLLEDDETRLHEEVNALGVEILAPSRAEVVHDAGVPKVRNVKTRGRLVALGGVGVFAMVLAGFTLLEWTAQRIASPAELTRDTPLRLLGSLPAPERHGVLGKLGFGEPNLQEWNRVLVESVDVVRTYLLRHLDSTDPQAVVVVSPSANEGKTTLSTQLGSSIARAGRKVCVVDCDFRRPSAHLVFQAEQGLGVSELLRAEVDVESATRETSIPGLYFISAGQVDDVSLRTLSMDGGEMLISTLKEHFDYVIVDTSPILFVAEPSMMAQHSDAVVMAVRRDHSRMSFVKQACETLRNLEAPLVGAVMIGAESSIHRQTYGYQQNVRFAEPQRKQSGSQPS